ncbi:MauE/DoxX family redox-associated membrane protein [Rhodopirellula sallentina]|nr:MauE/DoxX family redox-associated membrane protein [Rhodopirellula sallentina]
MNSTNKQPDRAELVSRYWSGALALLLGVSYRLWLPGAWTQSEFYPAVPLFGVPSWLGTFVTVSLMPLLMVGCGVVFFSGRNGMLRRTGWLAIAVMLLLGFATDQHRLQPWAYQSFLYACLFVLLPSSLWLTALRVLMISVYLYSSIGKFDFQFLHTVGQDFLGTVTRWTPVDISQWDHRTRLIAAGGFPAVELLLAILLVFPRTRRGGGVLAITMHFGLIVILSPWGMHHSLGVLCWNAVLAGQAYLLFVMPEHAKPDEVHGTTQRDESMAGRSVRVMLASVIVLAAVVLPLTERRGRYDQANWRWDHWLSWALYSPHNSRVSVEVHRRVIAEMPLGLRDALRDGDDQDAWREFDLGALSLQARGVPVLPQARYQLKLAIAIAEQQGWSHEIRGVLRSCSDRWDGTREEEWMNQLDAMRNVVAKYW